MWFSRVWVVLLAAVVALAFAVLLVLPRPAARQLFNAHAYKLDLVQHNAHLLLKVEAREAIDRAVALSRDPRLVETLELASTKQRPPDQLQAKALATISELLAPLQPESRPGLIILVDDQGKQVARVGPGAEKIVPGQHGIAGYPLVEAALRGLLRDDSWSVEGHLFTMAAAPLIGRAQQRYVGAVLLGQEVDDAFVRRLRQRLVSSTVPFLAATELAVFLRGRMIASTFSSPELSRLPLQFSQRRDQMLRDERSPAINIGEGATAHVVVMAPLRGEAAAHDAFYAIVGPPAARADLVPALAELQRSDFELAELLQAGGVFVALLVLGLLLLQLEGDSPLNRLLVDVRRLTRTDILRLPDRDHNGRHGEIARLINEYFDRQTKRPAAGAGASAKRAPAGAAALEGAHGGAPNDRSGDLAFDPATGGGLSPLMAASSGLPPIRELDIDRALDEGLEDPTSPQSQDNGLSALPALDGPGVMALDGPGFMLPEETAAESGTASVLSEQFMPLSHAGALPMLQPLDLPPLPDMEPLDDKFPAPSLSPPSPQFADPAPAPVTGSAPPPGHRPHWGQREPTGAMDPISIGPIIDPADKAHHAAPPRAAASPALATEEEGDTVMSSVPEQLARSLAREQPAATEAGHGGSGGIAPPSAADAAPRASEPELERYFQQVFKEFMAVKRSCGENVDNVTFERFARKLRGNRDSLIQRYGCHDVRFTVYVKDGKAALKATPIQP